MRQVALGVCLAIAAAAAGGQQGSALVTRDYPADHFSISVPSGWVEIPKAELDAVTAAARKALATNDVSPYSYGFQASRESTFPRVLIQVMATGRWSEDFISKMSSTEEVEAGVRQRLKSAGPSAGVRSFRIGRLTWDAKARVAWVRAQVTGPNGVAIATLSGMHPTSIGVIQVNCYSTQTDFERLAPLFAEVIRSVKIDSRFRYEERSVLARVGESVAEPALTGFVIGAAAVLLIRVLRRRRRPESAMPRSRKDCVRGAVWKLALGFLLLVGGIQQLMSAIGGDGWLQSSNEAQGYWGAWGAMLSLCFFLVLFGGRDAWAARAARDPVTLSPRAVPETETSEGGGGTPVG